MTESCRLITTEQYKEWKASEKKLEIATKVLKDLELADDIRICIKVQEALEKMEEL